MIIYPNPTNEQLIIVLRQAQHDINEIEITDVLGRALLRLPHRGEYTGARNERMISVSNLSSGVYFVRVSSNKGVAVKKFVKE